MLFSSILQYPQFCKQTTLLGSISYLAKDLTVSQGGDLLSCGNDREQKNIDLFVLHSPE